MTDAELEQERMFAQFIKDQEGEKAGKSGKLLDNLPSENKQFIIEDDAGENIEESREEGAPDEVFLIPDLISSINDGSPKFINIDDERRKLERLREEIETSVKSLKEKALQEGKEEGYLAGHKEGYNKGYQEGKNDFEKYRLEKLNKILDEEKTSAENIFNMFESQIEELYPEIESLLIDIIKNIVVKILGYETRLDTKYIKKTIERCLLMLPEYATNIEVKVSERDYELVKNFVINYNFNLISDENLNTGECYVNSDVSKVRLLLKEETEKAFEHIEEIFDNGNRE